MKDAVVVVRPGEKIRLRDVNPDDTDGYAKKDAAKRMEELREKMGALQRALYAEQQRSVLVVLQAMDTGGKDGAAKHLCAGIDPAGVHMTSFKAPSQDELQHDFLWRVHKVTPAKGMIGVWNRSHYEDVLVARVHKLVEKKDWEKRYEDINAFEKLLVNNRTRILKFYLHISKEEQKKRLLARLQDPEKLWKFNPDDLKDRARWTDYERAYEDVFSRCSTDDAPWHIVPANYKWARSLAIMEWVVAAFEQVAPRYPKPTFDPQSIVIE